MIPLLCRFINRLSRFQLAILVLFIYFLFLLLLQNYAASFSTATTTTTEIAIYPNHEQQQQQQQEGLYTLIPKPKSSLLRKGNNTVKGSTSKTNLHHQQHQQQKQQQKQQQQQHDSVLKSSSIINSSISVFESIREEWYDVMTDNPIYKGIQPNKERPIHIGLVTYKLRDGPTQHVFLDGIQGSDYLELSYLCIFDKSTNGGQNCLKNATATGTRIDLWLIDTNGVKTRSEPGDIVHQLLNVSDPAFRILFIDYSDRLVPRAGFMKHHYSDVPVTKFQQQHVRFGLRGIVKGRTFRYPNKFVATGKLLQPSWEGMLYTQGGMPFHTPFAVRTDIFNSILEVVANMTTTTTAKTATTTTIQDATTTASGKSSSSSSSSSIIPYHPTDCVDRPLDIIHLWAVLLPSKMNDLRNYVTRRVNRMANWTHPIESDRTLRVLTGIQGSRAHYGRWGVNEDYVKTMLQAKIVVVTQRDQWEDHFRLFEALASGSMVLMDQMLSLPHSLKNGESVVFFSSLDEMQDKAMYYLEHTEERLAIARKGWEISLQKHRSWHRLEEMLFGRGLTRTNIEDTWSLKTIQTQKVEIFEDIRNEWYDVIKNNPIYKEVPGKGPVQVGVITNRVRNNGPMQHVVFDGIKGSDYLELAYLCQFGTPCLENVTATNTGIDLWLIDAMSVKIKGAPNDIIHQLLEIPNPSFQILFLDYSDRLVPREGFMKNHYPDLPVTKFQQPHIRFGLRGIIDEHRLFRPANKYVTIGNILKPSWEGMLFTKAGLPFHTPFAVRTDIVNSIQQVLVNMTVTAATTTTATSSIPYHPSDCVDRPLDIIHLWEIPEKSKYNDLRNYVTMRVKSMAKLSHPIETKRTLRVVTDLQGNRAHEGRKSVSEDYVKTMLQAKIVVVTQRDQWEDHFRLFEALASGSMVLMDQMLSLPHSLKNGESVVFYDSLEDLEKKALYYLEHTEERLAIARKGWKISMQEHRSWHRLEEMLFGKGLTRTKIEDSWSVNVENTSSRAS